MVWIRRREERIVGEGREEKILQCMIKGSGEGFWGWGCERIDSQISGFFFSSLSLPNFLFPSSGYEKWDQEIEKKNFLTGGN